jgi:hypothetical protein
MKWAGFAVLAAVNFAPEFELPDFEMPLVTAAVAAEPD